MTFKEFYIVDKDVKSNCVVRSLCKILNKEYEPVRELDAAAAAQMIDLIAESRGDRLLLLVTHDPAQAEALNCVRLETPFRKAAQGQKAPE